MNKFKIKNLLITFLSAISCQHGRIDGQHHCSANVAEYAVLT